MTAHAGPDGFESDNPYAPPASPLRTPRAPARATTAYVVREATIVLKCIALITLVLSAFPVALYFCIPGWFSNLLEIPGFRILVDVLVGGILTIFATTIGFSFLNKRLQAKVENSR